MRPPLAGKRAAARRLAEEVRRRLLPVERVLALRAAGPEARERGMPRAGGAALEPEAPAAQPTPEAAAARIDAARERLRASIEPRNDADG